MEGFKKFILKGNVVELAVAVIIAAAFKTIIDAFVAGIVNPLLAKIIGKPNFDLNVAGFEIGLVITAIINFLMVAAVIYFFLVKPMTSYNERKKKDEEAAPPAGPSETDLLSEIRDLLKK